MFRASSPAFPSLHCCVSTPIGTCKTHYRTRLLRMSKDRARPLVSLTVHRIAQVPLSRIRQNHHNQLSHHLTALRYRDGSVQYLRHEPGPNALDLVGSRRLSAENGRIGRLHADHLNSGLPLLQDLPNAGHGAPGTHTSNEHIHSSFSIGPDLLRCSAPMNFRIRGIPELLRDERSVHLRGQLFSPTQGTLHAFRARSENEFRPCRLNHALANTVLDGATGIETLQFAHNLSPRIVDNAVQIQKRGVSH